MRNYKLNKFECVPGAPIVMSSDTWIVHLFPAFRQGSVLGHHLVILGKVVGAGFRMAGAPFVETIGLKIILRFSHFEVLLIKVEKVSQACGILYY
jgi:hypothetical protein